MDIQETEKTIKELQSQVSSMGEELNKRNQIDKFSSDEVKDGVREVVDEKLADSIWNSFFYHSGITPVGTLTSAANAEDVERLRISVEDSTTLSVARPTKMRVAFYFNDGTTGGAGCNLYLTTAHTRSTVSPILGTDVEFIGFQVLNGLFYLISYNRGKTTVKTTNITVSGVTSYLCEVRYYPRERADFFINNKYMGTISTNLPSTTDFGSTYVYNTLHCSLKGSDGATHNMIVDYYEFIQERK